MKINKNKIDKNKIQSLRIVFFGFLLMSSIISAPVRMTNVASGHAVHPAAVHSTTGNQSSGIITVPTQVGVPQLFQQQSVQGVDALSNSFPQDNLGINGFGGNQNMMNMMNPIGQIGQNQQQGYKNMPMNGRGNNMSPMSPQLAKEKIKELTAMIERLKEYLVQNGNKDSI